VAIYLDTNVVLDGLQSLRATSVIVVARAHGLDVAMPQLALQEAQAHRRRLIAQRVDEIQKALEIGGGLFPVPTFDKPDAARLAADWAQEIRKVARLIPARDQHAAEALHREIERLPPAVQEGFGARDSAIWLAIAEDHRGRNEIGYFLSSDKAFRDPDTKEPRLLRALSDELGSSAKPMHLAPAFEHVLGLLATEGGHEFDLEEIRANQALPALVSVAVQITGRLDVTADEMLASVLGPNAVFAPGVLSTDYKVGAAAVVAIDEQKVYQLGQGREVAVIETRWSMPLMVHATSGAGGLSTERISLGPSATLTLAQVMVVARIRLWAQRETAKPATFEIGNLDAIRVSVDRRARGELF
jgi:hypothetical protein